MSVVSESEKRPDEVEAIECPAADLNFYDEKGMTIAKVYLLRDGKVVSYGDGEKSLEALQSINPSLVNPAEMRAQADIMQCLRNYHAVVDCGPKTSRVGISSLVMGRIVAHVADLLGRELTKKEMNILKLLAD